MGFWIFMLIMDALIPIIMIGFGKMFLKKASKQINMVFGYRTNMSMKNTDTWPIYITKGYINDLPKFSLLHLR